MSYTFLLTADCQYILFGIFITIHHYQYFLPSLYILVRSLTCFLASSESLSLFLLLASDLFSPPGSDCSLSEKKNQKFNVVDICILYSGISVTSLLRILLASFCVNCFSPTSPPSTSSISTPSLLTVNFVCLLPFELLYPHNHHHNHHIHHHH